MKSFSCFYSRQFIFCTNFRLHSLLIWNLKFFTVKIFSFLFIFFAWILLKANCVISVFSEFSIIYFLTEFLMIKFPYVCELRLDSIPIAKKILSEVISISIRQLVSGMLKSISYENDRDSKFSNILQTFLVMRYKKSFFLFLFQFCHLVRLCKKYFNRILFLHGKLNLSQKKNENF